MPTVEQAHAARKTFPCPRVDPLSERDAAALAQVLTQRRLLSWLSSCTP